MSDYDGPELDDDELAELVGEDPDALTPEEMFKMVLINKQTGKKIWAYLTNEDGEEIELAETVSAIVNYMKDKMEDGSSGNQLFDQIMPLVSQSMVSGLGRLLGNEMASIILSSTHTRMAMVYMMMLTFSLYKIIQSKGLTIHTTEEDVDLDEIESIERKSRAHSIAGLASSLGINPKEVLQELVNQGRLSEDDIEEIMGGSGEDEDDGGPEKN